MEQGNQQRPIVGIGVMLFKDGKILLGKRKGHVGFGTYGWPGGKQEFKESFAACAKREVMEEAGIEISDIKFLRLMNYISENGTHFCDIQLTAQWFSGEPKTLESDKCEGWQWYNINNLPEPMFEPTITAIEAYKTGKNFFDN
ncbi:MAG: NUDIX domain-containing protein [Candidatus Doudnabacteria bacterium]|nr:NUDIX domain-containing protein [Candidatus Doudnabacteria bacterium]